MQKETKNIDKLFQKASEEFEKEPPLFAWDKLNNSLDKRIKKRKLIYFYRIAASILIVVSVLSGYYFFRLQRNDNYKITYNKTTYPKSEKNNTLKKNNESYKKENNFNISEFTGHQNVDNKTQNNYTVTNRKNIISKNKPLIKDSTRNIINYKTQQKELNTKIDLNNLTELTSVQVKDSVINKTVLPQKNETALNQDEKINKVDSSLFTQIIAENKNVKNNVENSIALNNNNEGRWAAGVKISPSFFNKNISENTSGNYKNDPITAYSGGLNVSYNLKENFSIETGVSYSGTEKGNSSVLVYVDKSSVPPFYGGNGVIPTPADIVSVNPDPLLYLETSAGNIHFISDNFSLADIAGSQNSFENSSYYIYHADYTIVQKFEFIELPVIAKYKIINKKIGVSISGGISSAYLIGNNSFILKDNKKYFVGNTLNLNKLLFNSITGLEINYNIFKKISMNVESDFKYAIKTITKNRSSKYYPYSISLSMGIFYNFK